MLLAFLMCQEAFSKKFIGDIYINRKDVFDSTQNDWFFAAPLANSLHILTKKYVIEDELLFSEGEELDHDKLYETLRNLRSIGIFSDVSIAIDSVDKYYWDVYVTTQDMWSTFPEIVFGSGGNTKEYGTGIEEFNLLGTAGHLDAKIYERTENDIGAQTKIIYEQRKVFRTPLYLELGLKANRFRTDQNATLSKPYWNLSDKYSFGVTGVNSFGSDFFYKGEEEYELMPFHEKRLRFWGSRAWKGKRDRVFVSTLAEIEDVDRGKSEYRRAFDNSGKFLVAFSSVSQDYFQTRKLNAWEEEDVNVGGWGSAILGKIFPIGSKGEGYYYVAGEGEKSYYDGDVYLFGGVKGASAFTSAMGQYTCQEAYGKAFYRLKPNLVVASRIRQQTVWNWNARRQLILDFGTGLRGYRANAYAGDNRIIANTELRFFPDIKLWIFRLSGVAFWDAGTVWEQNIDLGKTQWKHSAGLGIRFFNMKGTGSESVFRLDFAFNFDKGKFGEIIFTTGQLFSIYENCDFELPQILGTEFDYE